jgi:signal transduction histidine kinase
MLNLARRSEDEALDLGLAGGGQAPRLPSDADPEIARLRQLLRLLGHELGNSLGPMRSLAASARLLLDAQGTASGRLQAALATVEERAAHLESFVSGCVRAAQLAAPRLGPVDWQRLAARLEGLFPELAVEGVPATPITGDVVQIEQVLINLVKNAREAGGPAADVRLVFESSRDDLRVWVLDRGAGMTDAQLAAFGRRPFTTKPGGSGLGLGLCRTIVEAHGGRLRCERREGGGMRIGFSLPAAASGAVLTPARPAWQEGACPAPRSSALASVDSSV